MVRLFVDKVLFSDQIDDYNNKNNNNNYYSHYNYFILKGVWLT